jgi:hypothetical protein
MHRSYSELFKQGESLGSTLSWLNYTSYTNFDSYSHNGLQDRRFDLKELAQVVMNSPTWYGIFQKIEAMIKMSGFEVYEISDNGNFKITEQSRKIKKILEEKKIEQIIQNMLVSAYGLGLGGGVGYFVNGQPYFDPYTLDGVPRVVFWLDKTNKTPQIETVEIIDNRARPVYKFRYNEVYHYQFSNPTATFGFGCNGVVVAARWLRLEYLIMAANDQAFANGLHITKVASLNASELKNLGASQADIEQATRLLQERLKEANGIRNAGRILFIPFPMTFQDISLANNSQMRSVEILGKINEMIHHAMGIDKAILDTSKSKYDNIDQAVDLLYQSVQSFITDIQKLVERWLLPNLIKNYDPTRFIFRIPRQFSQEEIKIKEVNSKNINWFFENLKLANEALADKGIVALPTPDKLKFLQEQGIKIDFADNIEQGSLTPSPDNQTADYFTLVTHSDVIRQLEKNFLRYFTEYAKNSGKSD